MSTYCLKYSISKDNGQKRKKKNEEKGEGSSDDCELDAVPLLESAPFYGCSLRRVLIQHAVGFSWFRNQVAFSVLFVARLEILDAAVCVREISTGASS